MKKLFLVFLLASFYTIAFSQDLPDYNNISLDTKEDFNSKADDAALRASNFLFSTPLDDKNLDRLYSLVYIIKWMTGTPDYTFTLDEQATKFAKKNDDYMGLYMAAMTKYVLENKEDSKDENKIKLNAVKLIIRYAKDKNNKMKINSELKKLIEADEKGKLAEYLKI